VNNALTSASAFGRSGGVFDVDQKRRRLEEIENESAQESFWADGNRAKAVLKEKASLEASVQALAAAEKGLEDALVLVEFVEEDPSEENLRDLQAEVDSVIRAARSLELKEMLGGPNDRTDAIVHIN